MTDTLNRKQIDGTLTEDRPLAREQDRLHRERRSGLLCDYILAVEFADEDPGDAALAQAVKDAREAVVAFLITNGECTDPESAVAAIDSRQLYGLPKPGKDYSKVVPF